MSSPRLRLLPLFAALSLACSDEGGAGSEGETSASSSDSNTGEGDGDGDSSSASASDTATDSDSTDSDSTDSDSTDTEGEALRPNWHQDVAPLVVEACQSCHTDGGIAPFAMDDYAQTSPWASLMADASESGQMPPWHALETAECEPPLGYKHDARLSEEHKQLLRDWADIGAPEGPPEQAVPLPEPPSTDLDNPTTTVTMGAPVNIEEQGNSLDFFHCISLDPGHTEDVFVDGLQIVQGNPKVLHHVLVYIDENGASANWPGGVLEDCGGGTGVQGPTQLVAGWVPGSLPMVPPEGVGIELPQGARMILNVHYHATGAGPEIDEGTGLALRWTTQTPEYSSFFRLIGAPGAGSPLTGELMIPAGASGHVEEFEWTVSNGGDPFPDDIDVRLWAIANHMHLVGVDMRAWVEDRDTAEETCLLHTPKWDFNWQRIYEYDALANEGVRLKAGDKIHVRCEYDNTLDNPAVAQGLAELGLDEPIDVYQGEGTLDEMCLAAIGVGVKGI